MGITMDNKADSQAPTQGSSGDGPPSSNMFRLSVPDLSLKKECIESKLSKASAALKNVSISHSLAEWRVLTILFFQHGADMDTPLLSSDGFPRDDIDVTQSKKSSLL